MGLETIRNLDHTVLLCTNLPETRAFYLNVMKFPLEVDQQHWVSFRIGASLLSLRKRAARNVTDDGPVAPAAASVQLAFRVPPSAFEACYQELVAHGVTILREPTDLPSWRHHTIFFADPEHNIIEIYAEY